MKILELHKPKTPEWLGVWVCSFCTTKIQLDKYDVRRRVDYQYPCLWGVQCPGCNLVDQKWERPADE